VVVHEPELSLFPNWVDTTVVREVVLAEPRLELTTPKPLPFGGQELIAVLLWERVLGTRNTVALYLDQNCEE
jgi:hypothetical protein